MRTLLRYALLGLVLLTVMLVSALITMRLAIHGREIAVPLLVGMTPAEAERAALSNGLLVQVESRFYSADVPAGRIMSQVPAASVRVRRGWRIRVAESMGPQRVIIPSVVGQSPRAAELNLQRRGLEVGAVAVAHVPDLPPDRVVAQSPPANASLYSPKVSLLVTPAKDEQQFLMPDFVGRPLVQAIKAIQAAGFKLGEVKPFAEGVPLTPPRSSSTAAALIVKQAPAAGQRIAAGSTISFEVAQ